MDLSAFPGSERWWLAVDRDGHLACFDPGQSGAVPTLADQQDTPKLVTGLGQIEHSCSIRYDRLGRFEPGRATEELHVPDGGQDELGRTLMFLRQLDAVTDEITAGRAWLLEATHDKAVYFASLDRATARRLHDEEACLGCFWPRRDEQGPDHPVRQGLYLYRHLCEGWASGPYGRALLPEPPLELSALPEAWRAELSLISFPELCFAAVSRLQPVGRLPCRSSELSYLDLDGSISDFS